MYQNCLPSCLFFVGLDTFPALTRASAVAVSMGTKTGDGFSIGAGGAVVERRLIWGNLDRGYVLQGGTNQRGRVVFIAIGISYTTLCY